MQFRYFFLGCLCIFALTVMPAQAFTAKSLTVTLDASGNAQAEMQYDLSFAEQAAIFLHAANPATALQNALQNNLNRPVTVTKADGSSADVDISSFADVLQSGSSTTIISPAFSFAHAQEEIRNEWYAPLIGADFAPRTTTIVFPDGYTATYYNQISIPSVSHQVA